MSGRPKPEGRRIGTQLGEILTSGTWLLSPWTISSCVKYWTSEVARGHRRDHR